MLVNLDDEDERLRFRKEMLQAIDDQGIALNRSIDQCFREQRELLMRSQQLLQDDVEQMQRHLKACIASSLEAPPVDEVGTLPTFSVALSRQKTEASRASSEGGTVPTIGTGHARKSNVEAAFRIVREAPRFRTRPWRDAPVEALQRGPLRNFADSCLFNVLVFVVISLYVVFVGYEVSVEVSLAVHDYDSKSEGVDSISVLPSWLDVCGWIFNSIFLAELALRVGVFRLSFFVGKDWSWNALDTVLVAVSVFGSVSPQNVERFSIVVVLRVLRICWILRVFGTLRYFTSNTVLRNLRMTVLALKSSCVPLFWAVVTLALMEYLFAVMFMALVAARLRNATEDVDVVRDSFQSLPRSLLTLFMVVTGGADWWDLMQPLIDFDLAAALLLVVFVVVSVLAVLNVITGIFVNDALEKARSDHTLVLAREMEEIEMQRCKLTNLFNKLDKRRRGLTLEDLQEHVNNKVVQATFSSVGIEASDLESLFRLLDVDGNKVVEVDEFVVGCMRLARGTHNLSVEGAVMDTKVLISSLFSRNGKSLVKIAESIREMQDLLRTLVAHV